MIHKIFAICVLALSAIAAHGQGAVVLYEGARLIPGDGSPAINDAAILVDGGVIARIGRSGALTVAGGVLVRGNIHGDPRTNAGLLLLGTALASVMGTTGAAMLLVRPLVRANDGRRHNAHVLVFFIFLVANIGGSLTPLGDPPLFLGFLKGVGFFWTAEHLLAPMALSVAVVLGVFVVLDTVLYRRDANFRPVADPTPDSAVSVEGKVNFGLLAVVVAAVLLSGIWSIFPNGSIASFDMDGETLWQVARIFPGDTPESSVSHLDYLSFAEPTEKNLAAIREKIDFLVHVVGDEDYATGLGIQRTVQTGAKTEFVFGRNEGGAQHVHGWIDRVLDASDAELDGLFR